MKSFKLLIFIYLFLSSYLTSVKDKLGMALKFLGNIGPCAPGFIGVENFRRTTAPMNEKASTEGLRLANPNIEVQCIPPWLTLRSWEP